MESGLQGLLVLRCILQTQVAETEVSLSYRGISLGHFKTLYQPHMLTKGKRNCTVITKSVQCIVEEDCDLL
jgi:hypothetical protein